MDTVQDKTISLTLDSSKHGGNEKFTALLLNGDKDIGVILNHGLNSTPDDAPVGFLRRFLYENGFTTISLEKPIPKGGEDFPNHQKEADDYVFPEAFARIRAAMAELKKHNIKKTVLLGFSMGSRISSAFLAHSNDGPLPVIGLIGLGMGTNGTGLVNTAETLTGVSVPVYDIYGKGDENVSQGADARKSAYKGPSFSQAAIGDNNTPHTFVGAEEALKAAALNALEGIVQKN
jgi:pimeloyl-ACP methyl ester carboxylesterase